MCFIRRVEECPRRGAARACGSLLLHVRLGARARLLLTAGSSFSAAGCHRGDTPTVHSTAHMATAAGCTVAASRLCLFFAARSVVSWGHGLRPACIIIFRFMRRRAWSPEGAPQLVQRRHARSPCAGAALAADSRVRVRVLLHASIPETQSAPQDAFRSAREAGTMPAGSS